LESRREAGGRDEKIPNSFQRLLKPIAAFQFGKASRRRENFNPKLLLLHVMGSIESDVRSFCGISWKSSSGSCPGEDSELRSGRSTHPIAKLLIDQ
jgi:hypothetical protein